LEPSAPVIPGEPVAPGAPFSAGAPAAPCGPAGPAGPGTVTTTGADGVTAVGRSHALNASTDNAAVTTNTYLMMILLCESAFMFDPGMEHDQRCPLTRMVVSKPSVIYVMLFLFVRINFRRQCRVTH
jgi:hypothetical protein